MEMKHLDMALPLARSVGDVLMLSSESRLVGDFGIVVLMFFHDKNWFKGIRRNKMCINKIYNFNVLFFL